MKPFYQDEAVTIYNGCFQDALDPISGVQLIATSPPYNIGVEYDSYDDNIPWPDWYQMIDQFLRMSYKALRKGGVLALNVPYAANKRSGKLRAPRHYRVIERGEPVFARVQLETEFHQFLLRESLTWVKAHYEGDGFAIGTGIGADNNPYLRMVAEAFILASKEQYHFQGGTGKRGSKWARPMDWCKNVWYIKGGYWGNFHHTRSSNPTPWPRELCDRLILMFTNPGDIICDPFMGSGRLLLRAKALSRRAIGIEVSERDCTEAANLCRQGFFDFENEDEETINLTGVRQE
jgi:site-specific DNA-methyltransferase (adenine-specific)